MEVLRLGVESELQLPAYVTATAPDPHRICDLRHSSWQHQILNPLSEARDRTRNLKVPSQIHFRCAMTGMPQSSFYSSNTLIELFHAITIILYLAEIPEFFFFFFFGLLSFLLLLLLLLLFLGPLPWHMEVPRLGVESEL